MTYKDAEDFLGPRPEGPKYKNAEEFLGPRGFYETPSFDQQFDDQFSQSSAGALLDGFKQGFKNAWGAKPLGLSDENEKELKDTGIFNDFEKGQNSVIRRFNEAVIRPAAALTDFLMRGTYATAAGVEQAGKVGEGQAPIPSLLQIAGGAAMAGMEAFPAAHFTGVPFVGKRFPHLGPLHAMEDLGILDDPELATRKATEALAPTKEPHAASTGLPPIEYSIEDQPVARGDDVNAKARALAPNAFAKYEALQEQRRTYDEWIGNLQMPETYNIDGRNIPAGTMLKDVEDILSRPLSDREVLDFEKSTANTSLIEQIKKDMSEIDRQIDEVTPQIKNAYQQAGETVPVPELPVVTYEFQEPMYVGEAPKIGTTELKPTKPTPAPIPGAPPELANIFQRAPTIASQIYTDLRNAGRPDEEGRAAGAIWQAYYQTRAARLGTDVRTLFRDERPNIETGDSGNVLGKLNLASRTITLFKDANASTFLHESGHFFLEDLLKDAARADAPDDLKNDMATVKAWLQMEADRPTRAQHEQFANGFVRYVREGVAPNPQLAGVFEKFKQWLTQLYTTVTRLHAPINDEIRQVYARLLQGAQTDVTIAPERPPTRTFAEDHEAMAAASPTIEIADEIRAQRDRIGEMMRAEINNARKRSRFTTERRLSEQRAAEGGTERGGMAPGGEPPTGPDALGTKPNAEPTEIVPSGAKYKADAIDTGQDEPFQSGTRVVGRDGQPVLANLEAPNDIDEAVRTVANSSTPRGEISQVDQLNLSDATGIPAKEIDRGVVGSAYNSEEIKVLAKLAVDAETDVWNKMQEATESGDPLELAKSIARLEMIQAKATQAATEWGRAGQALRAFSTVTGTRAAEALNQLLVKHTGRSYDDLMQLAWQAKAIPTPRQVGALVHSTRGQMGPVGRAVTFAVTNSYLSGPFTHAAYVIGNELRVGLLPAEVGAAGLSGLVRRGLNIGPQDRVYMREAGSALSGIIQGTRDGLRPAYQSYLAGKQQPLPGGPPTSPWGTYSTGSHVVDNIVGQPTKIVAAIHQFSRVQFYTQYLYQLSMEQALDEGLSGNALEARIAQLRQNPSAQLMQEARKRADTAMFQREVPWNNLQATLSRWTERHVMAKIMFPFMKIGFEITRESIKRSPLAPVLGEVRDQLSFKEGGAGFDEAVGKMALGTGLLGAGLYYATQGWITGYGPTDPKQRSEWMLTHKPYSVNISNLSLPMAGLGPPGKLLQFGADLWETQHYAKSGDLNGLAQGYAKAVLRAGLDEGFFRDVTQLSEALSDPIRNGTRYLEGIAKGFVPYSSFMGQMNRNLIDPYAKDIQPGVAGIFDSMRSTLIGGTISLSNRVDMFGQPIPARGALPAVLDRDLANRYANDPTVQWLNTLGVGPGRLDRTILGVRLTQQQYTSLAATAGELSKDMLDQARPQLSKLTRGRQIMAVNELLGGARARARAKVIMDSKGTDNDIMKLSVDKKLDALSD